MNIKLFNIGGKVKPLAKEFKAGRSLQSLLDLIRKNTGDSGVNIVEYLKGESGAYIDTGIVPTKFDNLDVEFSDCVRNGKVLGAGRHGYRYDFVVSVGYDSYIVLGTTNDSYSSKTNVIIRSGVRYIAHCGDYLSLDGVVIKSYTSRSACRTNTLGLFGWHSGSDFIDSGSNKLYAFVMTGEDDVALANYIPIVDSSGEGMLFDLVRGETKRTVGNAFTYGNVVNSEYELTGFQKKSWGIEL